MGDILWSELTELDANERGYQERPYTRSKQANEDYGNKPDQV